MPEWRCRHSHCPLRSVHRRRVRRPTDSLITPSLARSLQSHALHRSPPSVSTLATRSNHFGLPYTLAHGAVLTTTIHIHHARFCVLNNANNAILHTDIVDA